MVFFVALEPAEPDRRTSRLTSSLTSLFFEDDVDAVLSCVLIWY
jgi:hypothetical protein